MLEAVKADPPLHGRYEATIHPIADPYLMVSHFRFDARTTAKPAESSHAPGEMYKNLTSEVNLHRLVTFCVYIANVLLLFFFISRAKCRIELLNSKANFHRWLTCSLAGIETLYKATHTHHP